MSFWDNLKSDWAEKAENKKEEEKIVRRLKIEAEVEKRRVFEEEFRKNTFEIARGKAKREAAEKSGLQKLRALNRARNLTQSGSDPGSVFSKFSTYTQRNLAKREENLKTTEAMRNEAKKMRGENMLKKHQPESRKPFSPSGFNNSRLKTKW